MKCTKTQNVLNLILKDVSRDCNLWVIVVNVLESDIVVREFEMLSRYYIRFQNNTFKKGMNPLIPPARSCVVPLLLFYRGWFGII